MWRLSRSSASIATEPRSVLGLCRWGAQVKDRLAAGWWEVFPEHAGKMLEMSALFGYPTTD